MTKATAEKATITATHKDRVTLHRSFWEAGHRVFGLYGRTSDGHCACGDPDCKAVLKHPLVSNWQHTPHWSEEQLDVMEQMGQFATGYGILLRGWLVIDIDARNGGLDSMGKLMEAIPTAASAGLIVNTGSGGGSRHLYFRVPEGMALLTKHPDYPGIDFKNGAAYVVGPGSLHASGNRYEIAYGSPDDIDDAPEELLAILRKPERHRAELGNRTVDVSHADLADMVKYVDGYDDYEVWVRVGMALHHASGGTAIDVWDQWSQQSSKYKDSEIATKWHSFGKGANPVTLGTLAHYAEQGGWKQPVTFKPDVDFDPLAVAGAAGTSEGSAELKAAAGKSGEPPAPHKRKGFRLTRVGELKYNEPVYLVADFVEAECLSMIFGDPACGKSFLGVDLALSVATGTDFHGRTVLTGPVVYLAGEGHNGLMRRVEAWSKERKVDVSECPLFLSQSAAQFLNDSLVREVAEAVETVKDKFGPPRLIVVDTVARSFGGGDENSTTDMTKFVAALDQFRERYGCTILLVHHTGHAEKKRARGNMALKGALDAEYRVEKNGSGVVIECTKMKDAPEPKPIHFSLSQVTLGEGKDGKPITSAVLRPSGDCSSDVVRKMTAMQMLAINAYEAAVQAAGVLNTEGAFAGIHLEDWRDQFYRQHTGDSIDTKRKAFNRARLDLVELRRFKVDNDVYFPDGDFAKIDEARFVEIIQKRDTGQ